MTDLNHNDMINGAAAAIYNAKRTSAAVAATPTEATHKGASPERNQRGIPSNTAANKKKALGPTISSVPNPNGPTLTSDGLHIAIPIADKDPLVKAAKEGSVAAIKALIEPLEPELAAEYVNAKDKNGSTPYVHLCFIIIPGLSFV
jgi:hypothetical protein